MSTQNSPSEKKPLPLTPKEKEESMKRLPKRLTYILRYGAIKEGLQVDANGFVPLDQLPRVHLLSSYTRDELWHEIECSVSYRSTRRYESQEKDGQIKVRAAYLRRFEENPVHAGTNVKTLTEISMNHILTNLDDYDLETFPDEDIIRRMFHRLKREKKLTVKTLQAILVPAISKLDLESVFLTNNILRIMYSQCPNLTQISFKGCGYIMTDTVLSQVAKNFPGLERLNLCQCNHLTSQCLSILAKRLPRLNTLHAAGVPSLTFQSVLDFLNKANALIFLDIYFMRYSPDEYKYLMELAESKNVKLILRNPQHVKRKTRTVEPEAEISPAKPEVDLPGWDHYRDFLYSLEANGIGGCDDDYIDIYDDDDGADDDDDDGDDDDTDCDAAEVELEIKDKDKR